MVLSNNSVYTSSIPASAVTTNGVQYYIKAADFGEYGYNYAYSPTNYPQNVTIYILDKTPPTITHRPIANWLENIPINISAYLTDNVGVDSVKLFYKKSRILFIVQV